MGNGEGGKEVVLGVIVRFGGKFGFVGIGVLRGR